MKRWHVSARWQGSRRKILRTVGVTALVLGQLVNVLPAFAAPQADASDEIVYLDDAGRIRVLDPARIGNAPEIKWSSPENGFRDVALGDVNNDGDDEIMGVRGGASDGAVIIYDPVVVSGANDGNIEGVPWRRLATIATGGEPTVIAAGNFDTGVNGDEFLVGYKFSSGTINYRVDVYHGKTVSHDGSSWEKYIADQSFATAWSDSSVGDVQAGGAEEVALVGSSRMSVFRPDNGFKSIYDYNSGTNRPANDVVIAQYTSGGNAEVSIVRNAPPPLEHTWFVFRNTGSKFEDETSAVFIPNFASIFTADVHNNGEDEFFMLRALPPQVTLSPHLITRNKAGNMGDFEARLDVDNGWTVGAGGDVDGNDGGKDEVVIIRNDKLRIYTQPEIGADAKNQFSDYTKHADGSPLTTDKKSIEIGDLDKQGSTLGYSFASSRSLLTASVPSGENQTDPFVLAQQIFDLTILGNPTLSRPISLVLEGNVPGFTFQQQADDTPNATPAKVLYSVNATTASPGVYTGNLVVTSSAQDVISTTRFSIPISLTVTFARVDPQPTGLNYIYLPCTDTLQPMTQTLQVGGTPGVGFTITVLNAQVEASGSDSAQAAPPWLTSVSPLTGTVPTPITVVVDPSQWSRSTETAKLLIDPDSKAGPDPDAWRNVPITIMCATTQNFLPTIQK